MIKKALRALALLFVPGNVKKAIAETRTNQTPVTAGMWFLQRFSRHNRSAYWPVHHSSIVTGARNICAGVDTSPGFMPGCYIQGMGRIYIGDYTQISANVGLITANHDVYDSTRHEVGEIRIGRYCWLGMNAVVLPGVELGDHTVVGAGSVVTSSFAEGYCVIAGNPAKKIRDLDRQRVVPFECVHKYNGYIRSEDFESYRKEFLNI